MKRKVLAGAALIALVAVVLVLARAWPRSVLGAPEPTLLLLDRRGEHLAEVAAGPDAPVGYWPVDQVPRRVAAAMIAIEDRNFDSHWGVDFGAVLRALLQNVRSGRRISGASTIAMQVARMQDPGPRTVPKKAVEAVTAMLLTARAGREAVLAHYLTIAPYGNNIHGIVYAARRYLDKPAEDLSWAEIAFLAAIPQSPSRMNPYRYEGRARAIARGQQILGLLFERGVLDAIELELARTQLDAISIPAPPQRPPEAIHFVLRAREELRGAREPMIVTSLDLELQRKVAEDAARLAHRWSGRGAENAALIVVARETREVLAYVGSADYFDVEHAGAIDFAAVPRPSGSTLKPFIFAHALDRGVLGPATIVDDLHRASGATENADRDFLGPLLPRVALGNSRNVPAVNLMHTLGAHRTYELFAELGLHDRRRPYDWYGSGIAIGLLPVTLADLVRAYTALAGDGRVHELAWVAQHAEAREDARRVFSEDAARQVTLFLSDPMARLPTFPRMGSTEYPFPVALKTGTSEGYRDAWTVAYSRRYVIGAWIGRADARPMTLLGGAGSAAKLVRAVMKHLHAQELRGFDDLSFPAPAAHVARRVCERTGLLATPACEHPFVEWFPEGDVPTEPCDAHTSLAIDTRTGRPAHASTPTEHVEARTFTALAPRYAAWAAENGLIPPPGPPAGIGDRFTLDPAPLRAPELVEPPDGVEVLRDPEAPPGRSTLALHAIADPRVKQLVFYVDGRPFEVVSPPFRTRWPLVPGEHVFEARLPYGHDGPAPASRPVRVLVQ